MKCGHANPTEAKFCSTCGVSMERTLCGCGAAVDQKSTYCGQCGQAVNVLLLDAGSGDEHAGRRKLSSKELLQSVEDEKVGGMNAVHEVASVNQDDIDELFD